MQAFAAQSGVSSVRNFNKQCLSHLQGHTSWYDTHIQGIQNDISNTSDVQICHQGQTSLLGGEE